MENLESKNKILSGWAEQQTIGKQQIISELEDNKNTQSKHRENRLKTNKKQSFRDLWDYKKKKDLIMLGIKGKGQKKVLGPGTNYGWKLPRFVRDTEPTCSGNLANLSQDRSKFTPRLVIIELLKNKEKSLKTAREK